MSQEREPNEPISLPIEEVARNARDELIQAARLWDESNSEDEATTPIGSINLRFNFISSLIMSSPSYIEYINRKRITVKFSPPRNFFNSYKGIHLQLATDKKTLKFLLEYSSSYDWTKNEIDQETLREYVDNGYAKNVFDYFRKLTSVEIFTVLWQIVKPKESLFKSPDHNS